MSGRSRPWLVAAALSVALAVLIVVALQEALWARADRLPGIDAGVHYAWEVYTRSVIATGHLPHWNPYLFGGMPHLANPQTLVFYPPAMLLRWVPPAAFLSWMAALHLWIAGVGAFVLARTIGIGTAASCAVALAAALGGSAGPWLHNGHMLNLFSAAWLPWALAYAVRSTRRPTIVPHLGLPLVLAIQFLAGYPQGSGYTLVAVAGYFLFCAVIPEHRSTTLPWWRPLVQLAFAGTIAAGLSAFQLLPFAQLVTEAARTRGVSFEAAIEHQWAARDLAGLLHPFVASEGGYRSLADRSAYTGLLLVAVAPAAFVGSRHRRWAVFFLVLGFGAVALALGENLPLYRLHHALAPGLRIPGRALFVATLGLAVVGAIGLERLVEALGRREWRPFVVASIATILAVIAAMLLAAPSAAASPAAGLSRPWILVVILFAILGFVALLAVRFGSRYASAAAILILSADLTSFAAGAIETIPLDPPERVRKWLGPPDRGRALSLCPNTVGDGALLINGQAALGGPGAVYLDDYADWLSLLAAADRPGDRVGTFPVRRDLLDAANVSRIVACEAVEGPALTQLSNVESIRVYRNDAAWPRAVWTCESPLMTPSAVESELRRARYEDVAQLVHRPVVSVRWAANVTDADRIARERQYHLREGHQRDGNTWRYVLHDSAPQNVVALLGDRAVEDTHGLDRATGAIADEPNGTTGVSGDAGEVLIGRERCPQHGTATLLHVNGPDGHVAAAVDAPVAGSVFFSEPYYVERQAFVDGRRVAPLKANLAFTAVPVPAGKHRVELRHVPTSFHAGVGISTVTLIAVAALSRLS